MNLEYVWYPLVALNSFFAGYMWGSQRRQPALQSVSVPTMQELKAPQPMWTMTTTTTPVAVPKPKRQRMRTRHANMLPTIITTNLKAGDFKKLGGSRLTDRWVEDGCFYAITGTSMRRKSGSEST